MVCYLCELRPTYFISSIGCKRYSEAADSGDTRKDTYVGHELLNMEAPLKLINPPNMASWWTGTASRAFWEYIFHTAMKILPRARAGLTPRSAPRATGRSMQSCCSRPSASLPCT